MKFDLNLKNAQKLINPRNWTDNAKCAFVVVTIILFFVVARGFITNLFGWGSNETEHFDSDLSTKSTKEIIQNINDILGGGGCGCDNGYGDREEYDHGCGRGQMRDSCCGYKVNLRKPTSKCGYGCNNLVY